MTAADSDIVVSIKALLSELQDNVGEDKKREFSVYRWGLLAKIAEAQTAFEGIPRYGPKETEIKGASVAQPDRAAPTDEQALLDFTEYHFWVDSFFTFLYSVFDVLGQVLNTALGLALTEKLYFDTVLGKLHSIVAGGGPQASTMADVLDAMGRLKDKDLFLQIEGFRHCAMHRRHLAVKMKPILRDCPIPGYDDPDATSTATRGMEYLYWLPDNPDSLTPSYGLRRDLLAEGRTMLEFVKSELDTILKLALRSV